MNFFISNAIAIPNNSTQNSSIPLILMIVIFCLISYFIIFRPQQKRVKEHKKLIDSIKKDDEVLTNGGLIGRVTKVKEKNDYITIALNDTTEVVIKRDFITTILSKDPIKKV